MRVTPLVCPDCGGKAKVVPGFSRATPRGCRRKRRCESCGKETITYQAKGQPEMVQAKGSSQASTWGRNYREPEPEPEERKYPEPEPPTKKEARLNWLKWRIRKQRKPELACDILARGWRELAE